MIDLARSEVTDPDVLELQIRDWILGLCSFRAACVVRKICKCRHAYLELQNAKAVKAYVWATRTSSATGTRSLSVWAPLASGP